MLAQPEQLVIPGCEPPMLFAGFSSFKEAKKHRTQHGGWIFQSDGGEEVYWFSLAFTPSRIMLHPLLRGLSGKLI